MPLSAGEQDLNLKATELMAMLQKLPVRFPLSIGRGAHRRIADRRIFLPRPFMWLVFTLPWLLAGCYSPSSYMGDGMLAETHEYASIYKITLGEVGLTTEGEAVFELAGLPRERFVVGFTVTRIAGDGGALHSTSPLDADIRLRLVNERDEIVIDQEGSIGAWRWTGRHGDTVEAFLYRNGQQVEIAQPDGGVIIRKVDVAADGGWGSSFDPRSNGRYRLEFTVLTPDPTASDFRVELIAYGGQRFFI